MEEALELDNGVEAGRDLMHMLANADFAMKRFIHSDSDSGECSKRKAWLNCVCVPSVVWMVEFVCNDIVYLSEICKPSTRRVFCFLLTSYSEMYRRELNRR